MCALWEREKCVNGVGQRLRGVPRGTVDADRLDRERNRNRNEFSDEIRAGLPALYSTTSTLDGA